LENKDSRSTLILIVFVIIALTVGLFGIIIVMYNFATTANFSFPSVSVEEETPDQNNMVQSISQPEITISNKEFDYNFTISKSGVTGIKDPLITSELEDYTFELGPPNSSSITKIKVPAIGVDAPIIKGIDGDTAVDNGWWLYPASKDEGEKIILAHRRYWSPSHPYSAWKINTLSIGESIQLYDTAGNVYQYQIISQSVREGSDLSVFLPADQDIVKLITCSTFAGDAGSSSHRYITIAKRI